MLLAIDVGNTHTVAGLFDGETLVADWRVRSDPAQTTDELCAQYRVLLQGAAQDLAEVEGVAVSSVVPSLTAEYREVGNRLFGRETLVIDHRSVDLPILNHDPATVGPDRIVNAVAAKAAYGTPVIVVDLGTATTFDVVNEGGEYAGGVIMPGISTAADALFRRGARLARVEISPPERVMGRSTEESIQSGVFYGAVDAVDGLVRRIVDEMKFRPDLEVVATGGFAESLAEAAETVTRVDQALTLSGIRLIWGLSR